MATKISWTDETWNPTVGCARVSEGCRNCYAEHAAAMVNRTRGKESPYRDLLRVVDGDPRWNGRAKFLPERLAVPLGWRKPRRDSMSDLFHTDITNEQIAAVFGVMAATPQHTYQVLTKRPERMVEVLSSPGFRDRVELFMHVALAGRIEESFAPERVVDIDGWPGYAVTSKGRIISNRKGGDRDLSPMSGESGHCRVMLYRDGTNERPLVHRLVLEAFDRAGVDGEQGCHIDGNPGNNALWNLRWGTQGSNWDDRRRHGNRRSYAKLTEDQVAEVRSLAAAGVSGAEIGRRFGISDTQARNIATGKQWAPDERMPWPLPSVWLGVSVENQAAADERIPLLLRVPAAVRFLSCEPLLGEVDLSRWLNPACETCSERNDPPRRDGVCENCGEPLPESPGWVIAGAESGPNARPCGVAWLRSLRDQCEAAGVPYFLKQAVHHVEPGNYPKVGENHIDVVGRGPGSHAKGRGHGGSVIELPYLDGKQHAAFPEVSRG